MLKRFRQEKAVWIKYGAFLLRRGQAGASHRVMQRALECLPVKERECSLPPTGPFLNTLGSLIWSQGLEVFLSEAGIRKALWRVHSSLSVDYMLMNIMLFAFKMLSSKDGGTKSN